LENPLDITYLCNYLVNASNNGTNSLGIPINIINPYCFELMRLKIDGYAQLNQLFVAPGECLDISYSDEVRNLDFDARSLLLNAIFLSDPIPS